MQLICALIGHQPRPFAARRRRGQWVNRCVLCQKPLVRRGRDPWQVTEEEIPDFR